MPEKQEKVFRAIKLEPAVHARMTEVKVEPGQPVMSAFEDVSLDVKAHVRSWVVVGLKADRYGKKGSVLSEHSELEKGADAAQAAAKGAGKEGQDLPVYVVHPN